MKKLYITALTMMFIAIAAPQSAFAGAKGVGIGVAGGLVWSGDEIENSVGISQKVGSGYSWGFFVDIPLLETFYISPAATVYELNLGDEKQPATDIDLNFKFMIPLDRLDIGIGLTAGMTIAEQKYHGHWGALAYVGYNLVSNIDLFIMSQYKQLIRTGKEVNDLHNFAGFMFRF